MRRDAQGRPGRLAEMVAMRDHPTDTDWALVLYDKAIALVAS